MAVVGAPPMPRPGAPGALAPPLPWPCHPGGGQEPPQGKPSGGGGTSSPSSSASGGSMAEEWLCGPPWPTIVGHNLAPGPHPLLVAQEPTKFVN